MFDAKRFYDNSEMAGTFDPLRLYASVWDAELAEKGDTPALICPIAASHAHCVPKAEVPPSIFFEGIMGVDGVIMTINVQLGGTQFIWLVDLKDAEIWQAIEMWRREKAVPVVLGIEAGDGWEYRTLSVEMPSGELAIEILLPEFGPMPPKVLWERIKSGIPGFMLRGHVKTSIQGVPLEHVFVFPLLTEMLSSDEHVGAMCKARKVVMTPQVLAAFQD